MKETIKVNLGGQLFDLDNDAYEKLKNYLDTLKYKFRSSPKEADEIVEDIEARIAELLALKMGEKKQVITLEDVLEIISQLGTAEEMEGAENEEEQANQSASSTTNSKTKKRFYRDLDSSVLGGVSSGLAIYFGIDRVWIRLLFVALFFAQLAGVVIYIILWIVIPPARTTAQKLEMKGKQVNINNIEESVKEEFDKVKSSFKNMSNSKGYKNIEHGLGEFLKALGHILLVFVKIVGVIVGVSLLLALILSILGLIAGGAVILPHGWFQEWHWPHLAGFSWQHITLGGLCLFLVIFIPILAIIVKIAKLLFGIESKNNLALGLGATVWVLALITFIVLLVVDLDQDTFRKTDHSEYILEHDLSKPLYIDVDLKDYSNNQLEYYQFFDLEFVWDEWHDEYLGTPKFTIRRKHIEQVKLDVYKRYLHFQVGRNPSRINDLAQLNWENSNSRLIIDEYYTVDDDYVWRLPLVELVLTIPTHLEVICNNNGAEMLDLNCNGKERIIKKRKNRQKEDKVELLEELEEGVE